MPPSGGFFNHGVDMAVKKSVRLTDITVDALRPFSDAAGEGMNWSGSINSMAEHLKLFVDALMPEFTQEQWNALYCAYNGYMPHPDPKEEARLLSWHLKEGYQYDPQIAEFLGAETDAQAFFSKLDSLSLVQRLCVIYKAKSYWRTGQVVDAPSQEV